MFLVSPFRGMEPAAVPADTVSMNPATKGQDMDVFQDRAARIAADHRDATNRAKDETASLLDSMRLAGFTFASDEDVTVADTLAHSVRVDA